MDEPAIQPAEPSPAIQPAEPSPATQPRPEIQPGDPRRSPDTGWRPWTAPVALAGGLVLAAVGGLVVDLPALLLGVKLTSSHTPPGLAIADTFVQDVAFVLAAVFCAHLGGRGGALVAVRAAPRPASAGRRRADASCCCWCAFLVLSVIWSAASSTRERRSCSNSSAPTKAPLCCCSARR